jgi:hypothetical protein
MYEFELEPKFKICCIIQAGYVGEDVESILQKLLVVSVAGYYVPLLLLLNCILSVHIDSQIGGKKKKITIPGSS